jgi:hypothetical protein
MDPIASFEQPFKGEFYSQGDIITTQNLSAGINLTVNNDASILGNTVHTPNIGTGEDNSVVILNSLGRLKTDEINPQVWDTTAKYISASDGALTVNRLTKATNSIGINESIMFDDGTNVGIGTDTPGAKLTVNGTLSTLGTATIGTVPTNSEGSSFIIETNGLLQKRIVNIGAMDTTAVFVSASDGVLTVNRLPKATNFNGINESIVYDDGTNVGIGTDTPSTKLEVNGSAIIQTDLTVKGNFTVLGTTSQLDTLVYTTSAVSITNTGTGPALTVTQTGSEPIARFIDSNGDDIIFDDNGYVGLGISSPTEKLDISGNLKTTGTATIGTLATGTTNSVIIESSGTLQKRSIDSRAWGSSLVDGTGTTNYVAKWSDADTITNSQIFDNGTNVGIGTALPSVKLDVNGVIRSNSNTVTPAATTNLPSSNDVILNNQTGPVTITAFSGGVAGVTYTLTNKSTHAVTLDTSASLFVRGGNSWASHKCTTNAEGYIVLPQNFSCSLRMDSATIGSAW